MFLITTNKIIRISRGDDSGRFPLFLNKGTNFSPIRYEMPSEIECHIMSKTINTMLVDNDKFKSVILKPGDYYFYYKTSYWYYSGQIINLNDFGISIIGKPTHEDVLIVNYIDTIVEVYFYILRPNADFNDYLVKKTFKSTGEIISLYRHKIQRKSTDNEIINSDGDMMLLIESEDTIDFEGGDYCYFIQVKVLDPETREFVLNTVTNKTPFYILDDDIDRSYL